MAYPKLFSSEEILKTAVHLVKHGDADGLSLRAVAAELGVKAPSLYRYFLDKGTLEVAVAEEILTIMLGEFRTAFVAADPDARFRRMVDTYLRFARERFPLYAFVMQNRHPERYGSGAGKPVWNLLLGGRKRRPWTAGRYRCCRRYLGPSCMDTPLSNTPARSGHPGPKVDWSEALKRS
jgi:AcrR family transcriptional regulator